MLDAGLEHLARGAGRGREKIEEEMPRFRQGNTDGADRCEQRPSAALLYAPGLVAARHSDDAQHGTADRPLMP